MSETKLLPCPFCGGEAEMIKRKSNFPYIHGVWCIGCKCRTSFEKSEEIAIEKWNTRKPVDDVLERLEELMEKAMSNSEKAAELGKAYEKHMIFNGAKGTAFEEAIDIVKEELGIGYNKD